MISHLSSTGKMFLFTLVLGMLFLPEADSLKCECKRGPYVSCSEETTNCSSQNDRCFVATQVTDYGYGIISERNYKGCIMSGLCYDYSTNYGVYRVVQKTSCCSGDLCNAQISYTKPDYNLTPNGRRCFSCEGENCLKTLNCVGDENYCFKITDGVSTLKGCASKMACSAEAALLVSQLTGEKISCCQGDYCNDASSTSPTLLLLLVPLLFSALFS